MSVCCTIVPDVQVHRHIPGAVQFLAFERGLRFSCPCGCGQTWSLTFPPWTWEGPRESPTVAGEIELCLEIGGKIERHWLGRLVKGEFVEALRSMEAEAIV